MAVVCRTTSWLDGGTTAKFKKKEKKMTVVAIDPRTAAAGNFIIEILAIAAWVGYAARSWWLFGVALIVLVVILCIRPLAYLLCIALAAVCGALGALGGAMMSGAQASPGQSLQVTLAQGNLGAVVVCGVLAFGIGLLWHIGAMIALRESS